MKSIFLARAVVSYLHTVPRTISRTFPRSFVRAVSYSAFQNSSAIPVSLPISLCDSITFGILLGRQYQIIPGATVMSYVPTAPIIQNNISDDIVEEIHQKQCEILALMKVIANIQSGGPNDASAQDAIDRVQARIEDVSKRLCYLLVITDKHYADY
ncbi:Protein of unknown function [Pyronema omphalodes CBS 100304]|uniref:Uncharacterized protein n=1 Tax=Pyronema omphalodes (strain CBS 100304) TaxID=1076935 RepID=U4LW71_PYROM|nr:Protein of unknown function [Pyronema omphalodes CBS 100304]